MFGNKNYENETKPDSNPGAVCGDAGPSLLKHCIPKAEFWRGLFPRRESKRRVRFGSKYCSIGTVGHRSVHRTDAACFRKIRWCSSIT
jgi:hypothetical protein